MTARVDSEIGGIMLIAWGLFGAVIGALAGVRRGFSPILGAVAGAVLGLFAPLLFLVSGVATAGDLNRRKCPHCAEFIKPEANVCKHCGRDLALEPTQRSTS
jgi:hypothetical protein